MDTSYTVPVGWWYVIIFVLVLYAVIEWYHTRKDHAVKLKEAAKWSIFYISAGLLFAVPLYFLISSQAATEYLAAFLTEKALSLDNLFVFGMIFAAFKVPKKLERRILNYGVAGAIFFRLICIFAGIALLEKFAWISVIFGLVLLRAAWHAYQDARGKTKETEVTQTRSWKILSSILPISHHFEGHKLFTRVHGKLMLTMMAATIIMVELTDILFAIDSVPAVLAISSNRFIAYSSNIFALLGLRALYFVYEGVADRFWALKWGIALILGWISIKLIIAPFGLHVSHALNLGVLIGTIVMSLLISNMYVPKPRT